MKCIVTAGPTYETLDEVRRLTNFSTGKLGTELARFLAERGHEVILLRGAAATYVEQPAGVKLEAFTTTEDLAQKLKNHAAEEIHAVFHAAAVSDYRFGRIWLRGENQEMVEVRSGKISTRAGVLLAELVPTQKIIAQLRDWYPRARLVGWKYEVAGERADVLKLAERQLAEYRTDASVANGAAYGGGFGLMTGANKHEHLADISGLYGALENFLKATPD